MEGWGRQFDYLPSNCNKNKNKSSRDFLTSVPFVEDEAEKNLKKKTLAPF